MQQTLLEEASIARAHQFAKAGKTERDLVMLSKLTPVGATSQRIVPQETYDALRPHAVPLRADSNGRVFIDLLTGPELHGQIARHRCAWQTWS